MVQFLLATDATQPCLHCYDLVFGKYHWR